MIGDKYEKWLTYLKESRQCAISKSCTLLKAGNLKLQSIAMKLKIESDLKQKGREE
jgi:hypothetical protein